MENKFLLADNTAVGLGGESFGPRMVKATIVAVAGLAVSAIVFTLVGGAEALALFLAVAISAGVTVVPDPRRSEGFRERAAALSFGRWTPDRRDGFLLDNLQTDAAFLRTEKPDTTYEGQRLGIRNSEAVTVRPPSVVGDIDWLTLEWRGQPACALVDDEDTASIALQVQARTEGVSQPDDLAQARARLGQALDLLAERDGFTDRIAQLLIVSPTGLQATTSHDRLPATTDEWGRASYAEAEDRIGRETEDYINFVVIQIPQSAFRDKAVAALGVGSTKEERNTSGLCKLIRREANDIAAALNSAGLTVLGAANVACTAMAIRNTFDRDHRPLRWNTGAPFTANDAWPTTAPIDRRDAAVCDGWHTSTAEVRWPDDWVAPDLLRNLTTDIHATARTITTVFRLTPAEDSRTQSRMALALMRGNLMHRAKRGYAQTSSQDINMDAIEQLDADVAHGAHLVHTVTYIGVSTRCTELCETNDHEISHDQEDAKRAVANKAGEVNIELRWLMKGHLRNLPNLMPLGRGLK